jgi:hypothetical protein
MDEMADAAGPPHAIAVDQFHLVFVDPGATSFPPELICALCRPLIRSAAMNSAPVAIRT